MTLEAIDAGLSPLLVWGLFSRFLGVVFLVSFLSIAGQIIPLAGSRGFAPVFMGLDHIRKCFSPGRRLLHFPTLLWLGSGDALLRALPLVGAATALSIIVGGPHSPWAIFACYVIYHTLDRAVGLVFPWDCVLFEASLFGVFLPSTHLLPDLEAVAAPLPAIAWVYRLLPFRVLLGFGKFKFLGATKDDAAYLTGFLINQPMVSPIGFYLHKAPVPLLKLALFAMFLVEIPGPFFLLWPGWPGIAAAIASAGLMLGIWATGNFGYFNLVLICLLTTLLDTTTVTELDLGAAFSDPSSAFPTAIAILHTVAGAILFPLNTFVQVTWPQYPLILRIRPKWLTLPLQLIRLLHPMRWVHPYGVFPPKTMAGVKCVLLFEVTWDGKTWVECRHRFSPSEETSPPKFIAPYHPRCDQAIIYESFGFAGSGILSTLVGSGLPFGYTKHSGVRLLAERILDGNVREYGSTFFEAGTFDGKEPPVAVRATTVMLEPLPHAQRKDGRWWTRRYVGPHLPETRFDPDFKKYLIPEPELWHPEDIVWKRRSRLAECTERLRVGDDPHRAVLAGSDLTAEDVERFWAEFVPMVGSAERSTWDALPDVVDRCRAAFDTGTLYRLERLFGRYSFLLSDRVDPLFFDAGLGPLFGKVKDPLGAKSYLQLVTFTHLAILEGREGFEAVLREPASIARFAEGFTLERGLFALVVFRYEAFVFEAQKARLVQAISEPERDPAKRPDPAAEEKLRELATRCFGVLEAFLVVADKFKGPRFENGQPERYPRFRLDERGVAVKVPEEHAA